jgi:hypothetical protein
MSSDSTTNQQAAAPGDDWPSEPWESRAETAMIEAQGMSEAIEHLTSRLCETASGHDWPDLRAISACAHRIDAVLDDLIVEHQTRRMQSERAAAAAAKAAADVMRETPPPEGAA